MARRWSRERLLAELDGTWAQYPLKLAALPAAEQLAFAQQQGYARPQDLLAHIGAWLEETRRVLPYLQRDERPPRTYASDAEFNARVVQRFQAATPAEVEAWYQQQRVALARDVAQLPLDALRVTRVYRWLTGTIVGHYAEHPLP